MLSEGSVCTEGYAVRTGQRCGRAKKCSESEGLIIVVHI